MNFKDLDINNFNNALIFLDIDGTITEDKSQKIDAVELLKIKELQYKNKLYLCSNGNNSNIFSNLIGVPYIQNRKPFIGKSARNILRNFDSKTTNKFVIGDKFLTDGLFALLAKSRFIKIRHKVGDKRTLFERLSYLFDDIVWFFYQIFILVRPLSWVKSLLVFAPIFFAGEIFEISIITKALKAFVAFCFASSFVYVLNDIADREVDRKHMFKKYRPLANGAIGIGSAYFIALTLVVFLFSLLSFVPEIIIPITIYIVLNGLYTIWLKHIAVLDIILVSSFYLLRVLVGGVAVGVYISPWIIMCAFFGSLFVISGKRRAEHAKKNRRQVLDDYSDKALDYILAISSSLAVMGYAIWSVVEHDSPYLVYSTIFVVFSLFRVLNRVYTHPEEAESPEILVFKDVYILSAFIFWVIYMYIIFYQ